MSAGALAELRRLVPEGSNAAIVAALTTLADHGDAAALREAEAHLAGAPLALSYGDRDDDPSWELTPQAFAPLARWWQRLGLADERAAWLVDDWLGLYAGPARPFGSNGFAFFTNIAPLLAHSVAPRLIAACGRGPRARRKSAAAGLKYAPSDAALDALVALLGDADSAVADEARFSLSLLASPPSPGSARRTPSAPDAVALRLIDALDSDSAAVRLRALGAFAWAFGERGSGSARYPPQFIRALVAIARLLVDPDPQVQRRAAERVGAAGYHLDRLRPGAAAALAPGLRLPPLDLRPLLDHPDPEVARAALHLAGRCWMVDTPPGQEELAARILALLDGLRGDVYRYRAALYALGRLGHAAAIPAIARNLEEPKGPFYIQSLIVLARLRHRPALPHLVRLLSDITYGEDAQAALGHFPSGEVVPLLVERCLALAERHGRPLSLSPWVARYLETHGATEALALLRQTDGTHPA